MRKKFKWWLCKKIGAVPCDVFNNMKRSRNHWRDMYAKHNNKLKAMPVGIDFTYKGKTDETE